jgi:hypothetical protein
MQGDRVSLRVNEVHGADETGLLFPVTVLGGPENLEYLSVSEEMGNILLTHAEIDFKLIMPVAVMLGKEYDHIFKRHLPLR